MILLAQTGGIDWMQGIIQLATAGGFGALVWYLVIKHIPSIETRHKSERDEWLAYIKHRDDSFSDLATQTLQTLHELKAEIARSKS